MMPLLTQLGGVVVEGLPDGTIRTLRRVYTNAIQQDGSTPDAELLQQAIGNATKTADAIGHNEGVILDPWENRPS